MNKHIKKVLLFLFIILFILAIVYIVKNSFLYYKCDDRINELKKAKKENNFQINGWLKVQGTDIDFPILYQHTNYDLEDPTREIGWSDPLQIGNELNTETLILSHNMRNLSSHPLIRDKNHQRFEQLMSFIYYDFAKKNKYIQYTIGNKNYLFKIYAVYFKPNNEIKSNNNISYEKAMTKYFKAIKNESIYDYNVDLKPSDKIIILETCSRFFDSSIKSNFRVEARLVRNKERINNYRVKKNNKYKKIEKVLNGDE